VGGAGLLVTQVAHSTTMATAATASRITVKVPATAIFGQAVALSASVTGAAPITGTVTFLDNGAVVPPANRKGTNGRYSVTTSNLTMGAHSITASFSGDAQNAPSSSAPATITIGQAGTGHATMTLQSNPASPVQGGTPLTLSATLTGTPGLPTPAGTVSFKNGAATISTGRSLVNGTASVPNVTLPVGSTTISAAYSGDANYAPATGTMAITVTPSTNDNWIRNVYTDMLGLQDPNGQTYWSAQLTKGMPRWQMALSLTQTPAYRQSIVQADYQTLLHRAVDPGGLHFWTGQLQTRSDEAVAAAIASSGEAFANAGTIDGFVTAAYSVLLGRAPDPAGAAYWRDFLAAGGQRWQMTLDFVSLPEWAGKVVAAAYTRYHLGAPGSANDYWVGQMLHGMSDERLAANLVSSPQYDAWAQTH
jgi:hypothetical protein